jgi:hypothetical protein
MEPLHADLFVIGFGKAGKTVAAAHGRRFCKLGCILQGSSTIAGYVRVGRIGFGRRPLRALDADSGNGSDPFAPRGCLRIASLMARSGR